VSSKTAAPIRTIYWTEGSFDGPKVPVTDGRITTVNPVFNSSVPKAVAQEVEIPGYVPNAENLTTLSFDKYNGSGMIHAYNVEGRILIEYLGNVRLGNNVYESLGVDVVDMVRAPDINYSTVHLGRTLTPHDGEFARLGGDIAGLGRLEAALELARQRDAMLLHIGGIFRRVELNLHILIVYTDNNRIKELIASTKNAQACHCQPHGAARRRRPLAPRPGSIRPVPEVRILSPRPFPGIAMAAARTPGARRAPPDFARFSADHGGLPFPSRSRSGQPDIA
jgi:hypothetical protein